MTEKTKFPHLAEPGYIGSVKTKNRMLRMGAWPGFAPYEDGYIQDYYFEFYGGLAKGGIGLVTIGGQPMGTPQGGPGRGYNFDNDQYIPRMREFTDSIHKYGCPVFMQLFNISTWMPAPFTAAASTFTEAEMPITIQSFPNAHALTIAEIKNNIKQFAEFAVRVKKCGFDGVEINAGCTHLLSTFLSQGWNKRTDEYGFASIENRTRIVVDIIKEIRKANGKDFGIAVVYNTAEPGLVNGITIAEGVEIAKAFEAAGADAITARAEYYNLHKATKKNDSTHFPDVALFPEIPDDAAAAGVDVSHYGEAGWSHFAAEIKKAIKIPVIGVGRMSAELGEKLIKQGSMDFISLNRRTIADHDYANKILAGELEDIAPCTACMSCFNLNELGGVVRCRINAAMGQEKKYEITPAAQPKKIVVIGGGPAGMEAARIAALRGHKVTLLEKEPMLGGAMNLSAVVKGTEREDVLSIVSYLKTQVAKAGVDVKLGKEATRKSIEELKPDVVIVAVGGEHNIPDIPGIDRKNVLTSQNLHHQLKSYLKLTGARLMTKLVTKYVPVGKSVVVLGGNIQGCQTAEFLVKRGRKVTVLETAPEICEGFMPFLIKPQLLDWLDKQDVPMLAGVKYDEITEKGVTFTAKDGRQQTIEADTILTTLPLKPNMALFNSLKGSAAKIYEIGDCARPGLLIDAVAEGARIAREI